MNITINRSHTIAQIQEEFQKHFPYLKIEFYSKSHDVEEGSNNYYQLHHNLTIGNAQFEPRDGVLHISPGIKVKDLELLFQEVFGLNIQVFRLSGKVWLQTTATDYKTLAEQNEMALEMSKPVRDKIEIPDIHEQE